MRAKKVSQAPKAIPARFGTHTREFPIVEKFTHGYRNREDITTLPPGIMVSGSQNVLTNVYQRVGIRRGFVLDGQRDNSRNPIMSAFDWERHTGNTLHLRSGGDYTNSNGNLQFRFVATETGQRWKTNVFTKGQVYWIDLLTGLSSVSFNYADYWDTTELISKLLFVNGRPQIDEWTGGVAILKSTSNQTGVIAAYELPGIVQTVSVNPFGTGNNYVSGDLLTLAFAGGKNCVVSVAGVDVFGAVLSVVLVSGGSGYATGTISGTTGGNGNSATVTAATVNCNAGTGYTKGDVLTVAGGIVPAQFEVTSVSQFNGAITSMRMITPGNGYTPGIKNLTGGTGANGQINILTTGIGWIEKYGDATWAEEGFYIDTSGKALNINGNIYTYTAGADTTFLVGISGDPTGEPLKSVIFQQPLSTLNSATNGLPDTLNNSLIANLRNQIYIASGQDRSIYISHQDNYKKFTYSSPRVVGEGAVVTLDGIPTTLIPQQSNIYVSAGKDQWYMIDFRLAADNVAQAVFIQRLKTTSLQGSQSQALATKVKNYIAYVSFEQIVNLLGIEPNFLLEPRVTDISFPIVNDMQNYDFTEGSTYYFPGSITMPGTYLLVAIPSVSTVLIYNMTESTNMYWEAPQIIPVKRFSIIDGELYGHSSQSSNTFKLFTGTNDDSHAVEAVATFSFNNNGVRTVRKSATATYVEGYIAANTTLNLNLQRDMDGMASSYSTIISGNDTQIVPPPPDTASLGKTSLGKNSLGAETNFTSPQATPPKFRVEKTYPRVEYFEEQVSFQSIGVDQVWEILAFGSNAAPTTQIPTDIRE